jgi:hypothetical protein
MMAKRIPARANDAMVPPGSDVSEGAVDAAEREEGGLHPDMK